MGESGKPLDKSAGPRKVSHIVVSCLRANVGVIGVAANEPEDRMLGIALTNHLPERRGERVAVVFLELCDRLPVKTCSLGLRAETGHLGK